VGPRFLRPLRKHHVNSTIARALKHYAQALEEEQQQLQSVIGDLREELREEHFHNYVLQEAYGDFMLHEGSPEYEALKAEVSSRVEQQLQDADDDAGDAPGIHIYVCEQSAGDSVGPQHSPEPSEAGQTQGAAGQAKDDILRLVAEINRLCERLKRDLS